MPATVTLTATTLAETVTPESSRFRLTSTSGVVPGKLMFLDGELVRVTSFDIDTWVNVQRGMDGTRALPHVSLVPVYIGDADQFYSQDPVGRPPAAIPVSPHINVRNGAVWFAQGDTVP